MKIDEICSLLSAEIHNEVPDPDFEIERAFASDLMSDVLTLMTDHLLLITGLNNIQTIRTAEMSDIGHVLIVRGKKPNLKMIELADELGIVLLSTRFSMFKASGILYTDGLEAVF
jgi:predicted transcriptional regulator